VFGVLAAFTRAASSLYFQCAVLCRIARYALQLTLFDVSCVFMICIRSFVDSDSEGEGDSDFYMDSDSDSDCESGKSLSQLLLHYNVCNGQVQTST
jgi:hypothetical protein